MVKVYLFVIVAVGSFLYLNQSVVDEAMNGAEGAIAGADQSLTQAQESISSSVVEGQKQMTEGIVEAIAQKSE